MAPLVATDLFAAVKSRVSIGEMLECHGLRHRGRSIQCPNHSEHTHGDRSMSAWIASTGRTWHCYGGGPREHLRGNRTSGPRNIRPACSLCPPVQPPSLPAAPPK
jgi:hypothetical protein